VVSEPFHRWEFHPLDVLRDNCRSRFDGLRGCRLLLSTRIMASRNDQSKHGNRNGLVTRLQHTAGRTHCWRCYFAGATTYLWSHCSCRGSLEFSFLRWIGPRVAGKLLFRQLQHRRQTHLVWSKYSNGLKWSGLGFSPSSLLEWTNALVRLLPAN
jgi:hypothetical protein